MKRGSPQERSREISPSAKQRRRYASPGSDYSSRRPGGSSGGRFYNDRDSNGHGGGRSYHSDYHSRGRGGGVGRPGPPMIPRTVHTEHDYVSLKIWNLNNQISNEEVEDCLYHEFKKFGDLNIKVVEQPGKERVAYLNYKYHEDAKIAKMSRDRPSKLWGRHIEVDPVYYSETKTRVPYAKPPYDRPQTPPRYEHYRSPPPPRYSGGPPRGGGPGRHHSDRSDYRYPPPPDRQGQAYNKDVHISRRGEVFASHLDNTLPEDDGTATRTLFVGNIEPSIPENEVRRIFERFGVLIDVDIKRPLRGQGNAYAFIRYENLDMAHRAKCELSGQYIGKFECKIGYGKPHPSNRVWVGNLGAWASFSVLEQEFDRFGAIRKIDYVKGDNYAYVTYDTIEAAQAACKDMRGFPLGGPDKRLRVDFADPSPDIDTGGPHHNRGGDGFGGGPGGYPPYDDRFEPYPEYHERGGPWRGGDRGDRDRGARPPRSENWDGPHNGGERAVVEATARIVPEATNVEELANAFSIGWQGCAVLKKSAFPCKMFVMDGDASIIETLMKDASGSSVLLHITQRLRLEQSKLDDVSKRITSSEHCIMLCLPGTEQCEDPSLQTRHLKNLVTYLKSKEAAGVIALTSNRDKESIGVLYAFPACQFSQELLLKQAPNLGVEPSKDDHIVIVVVREKAGATL